MNDAFLKKVDDYNFDDETRLYVYWRSLGMPPRKACSDAGIPVGRWRVMENRPDVQEAILTLFDEGLVSRKVTKASVEAILFEAIEVARRKDMPKVMIEGARALADINQLTSQQLKISVTHPSNQAPRRHYPGPATDYAKFTPRQLEKLVDGPRVLTKLNDHELDPVPTQSDAL